MCIAGRIKKLKEKHQQLSEAAERLECQPHADTLALKALKKQKLKIKDELTRRLCPPPVRQVAEEPTSPSCTDPAGVLPTAVTTAYDAAA